MATVDTPSDANVLTLLHFDNNLTDIIGKAIITNSGVTFNSTVTKFGGYSAYFNGTSYLKLVMPNTTTKTIEFWYYDMSTDTYPTPFSTTVGSVADRGSYIHTSSPMYMCVTNNATQYLATSTQPTKNAWHHFAYCNDGTNHYFFIDGVLKGTINQSIFNAISHIFLGAAFIGSGTAAAATYFRGYIDELRISDSCRWTSAFTVPTVAYTISSMSTNTNVQIKSQYRGLSGANRLIKEQYRGYGGVNRLVFGDKKFLYNLGDECTATTGGWINKIYASSGGGGSYTKNTGSILVTGSTSLSSGECGVSIDSLVDLTGYTKICINVLSGYEGYYKMADYAWASYCSITLDPTIKSGVISAVMWFPARVIGESVFDISGYNGMYYIGSMAHPQGYGVFDRIWLE